MEEDTPVRFELQEYSFHRETHTQLCSGRESREYTHVVIKRATQTLSGTAGIDSHVIELLDKTEDKSDKVHIILRYTCVEERV